MEKVKSEIPLEELLKEKRHKELKALLLAMLEKLNTPVKEIEYRDIETKELDITGIEEAISKINLTVDISELPKSIQALEQVIVSKLDFFRSAILEIKQPKEWDFTINRNIDGLIKSVKARSN